MPKKKKKHRGSPSGYMKKPGGSRLGQQIESSDMESASNEAWENAAASIHELEDCPVSNIYFEGVKSSCLEGRLFTVEVLHKSSFLVIKEIFLGPQPRCHSYNVCFAAALCDAKDRIIGHPICVACNGNLVILQYITHGCKYLRFFLVDLDLEELKCFEDSTKYLKREYASVWPAQCLISPGKQWLLVRLPEPISGKRRWCKILFAPIHCDGDGNYMIDCLIESSRRDRSNQSLVFDPRYRSRLTSTLVNEYCSRCMITVYNLDTNKAEQEISHRLIQHWSNAENNCEQDTLPDDENILPLDQGDSLTSVNGNYCQSGELLVMCCIIITANSDAQAKVFIFNSDTMALMKSVTGYGVPRSLRLSDIFTHRIKDAIISHCDSFATVGVFHKGDLLPTSSRYKFVVHLPKTINLKNLCRVCVLKHCEKCDIVSLKLPVSLTQYLRFQPLNWMD